MRNNNKPCVLSFSHKLMKLQYHSIILHLLISILLVNMEFQNQQENALYKLLIF